MDTTLQFAVGARGQCLEEFPELCTSSTFPYSMLQPYRCSVCSSVANFTGYDVRVFSHFQKSKTQPTTTVSSFLFLERENNQVTPKQNKFSFITTYHSIPLRYSITERNYIGLGPEPFLSVPLDVVFLDILLTIGQKLHSLKRMYT